MSLTNSWTSSSKGSKSAQWRPAGSLACTDGMAEPGIHETQVGGMSAVMHFQGKEYHKAAAGALCVI